MAHTDKLPTAVVVSSRITSLDLEVCVSERSAFFIGFTDCQRCAALTFKLHASLVMPSTFVALFGWRYACAVLAPGVVHPYIHPPSEVRVLLLPPPTPQRSTVTFSSSITLTGELADSRGLLNLPYNETLSVWIDYERINIGGGECVARRT
jgi:hypothetical protein